VPAALPGSLVVVVEVISGPSVVPALVLVPVSATVVDEVAPVRAVGVVHGEDRLGILDAASTEEE